MTKARVRLIAYTPNIMEVLYTACTTCYNSGSPVDKWQDVLFEPTGKEWQLIYKVFDSGHLSTSEHISFTFAIDGISRACSHQLVRHRHCSFSQQSQRYVNLKDNAEFVIPESLKNAGIVTKTLKDITACYDILVESGIKPEDARVILPNATKTNMVLTCNLRELMHICNERLCTRAQKEIRELVRKMSVEVVTVCPELHKYLQPKCEILGYCREHKCCGRKEKLR